MKLLIVIVALIEVPKADCRHFSDEPTNQVSISGKPSFTDELVDSGFTDEDQYIAFEPEAESPDSNEGTQKRYNREPASPAVEDGNNQNEIHLRGETELSLGQVEKPNPITTTDKTLDLSFTEESRVFGLNIEYSKGGKRDLQKLIKNFESMKYNLTQANLKIQMELQSIKDNQNNISNIDTKLKLLILAKIENITDGSKQLKMELKSLKDFQNNVTNAHKENKMELNSMLTKQNTIEAFRDESISNVCEDKNRHCVAWSDMGQCRANPNYMMVYCKKACNICVVV